MHASHTIAVSRHQPDGLRRTMAMSFAVHVGIAVALFVIPRDWLVRQKQEPIAMTLQMGSPGEKTGGLNAAGAQRVETVEPPPKRPTPTPVVKPPDSQAIAVPTKPPPKATPKPADTAPVPTTPQRPIAATQVTQGTAASATGATGQGTGLTVGGGAGGASATFDSKFCCIEYAQEVLRRIGVNWKKDQQESGEAIIVFEIRRDGSFSKPEVEKSSGHVMLDIAAQNAFTNLRLPPLPEKYTGETLKIHLNFPYKR